MFKTVLITSFILLLHFQTFTVFFLAQKRKCYVNSILKAWGGFTAQKWGFTLRISSGNVNKYAENCGFGRFYWSNT